MHLLEGPKNAKLSLSVSIQARTVDVLFCRKLGSECLMKNGLLDHRRTARKLLYGGEFLL